MEILKAKTKLTCWSTGPTDPTLRKNNKILKKFWSTGFF